MIPTKPAISSKANSASDGAHNTTSQNEEAWVCHDNVLRRLLIPRLPLAQSTRRAVEIATEGLSLALGDGEAMLAPSPGERPVSLVRSVVSEGRVLAESDRMTWAPVKGVAVSRTLQLTRNDHAQVDINLRFRLAHEEQGAQEVRPRFTWSLTLPPSAPFILEPANGAFQRQQTGKLSTSDCRRGRLLFSFDAAQPLCANNRLVLFDFLDVKPQWVELTEDAEKQWRVNITFTRNLAAKECLEINVCLRFMVLLSHALSDTVFLVARPEVDNAPWQAALAAAMCWVDPLEVYSPSAAPRPTFQRLAPFLWFDRERPLPDAVLRFLHEMPSLQRIIVFGNVQVHDLENLLTALLNKGAGDFMRLQIFTEDEYYRDRVNVLRGNIQARMLMADETAERIRRLEEIISTSVVPAANCLPLAALHFVERNCPPSPLVPQPAARNLVFLVDAAQPQARYLAAAAVPFARHLAAPIFLWSLESRDAILAYLAQPTVARVFMIGAFADIDTDTIRKQLTQTGDDGMDPLTPLPLDEPVAAAATLARLHRAHLLLDWLVRELHSALERRSDDAQSAFIDLVRNYLAHIQAYGWAQSLVGLLRLLLENSATSHWAAAGAAAYQDLFVTQDEFIRTLQEYFVAAAEQTEDPQAAVLINRLAPVWNDLVVISDFEEPNQSHHDFYIAACFAAYHNAPLLLYPAISDKNEAYVDQRVKDLEQQFLKFIAPEAQSAQRNLLLQQYDKHALSLELGLAEANQYGQNISTLVFPQELQQTLRLLNPMGIGLYSSDVRVPYEVISDQTGPIFLNYVMGHVSGADAYETSLATASSILYGDELQRHCPWNALICLANLPDLPLPGLVDEGKAIRQVLAASADFKLKFLTEPGEINKRHVLTELAKDCSLFHFAGHGFEDVKRPQLNGIFFWHELEQTRQRLNALELKYHTKLGAHPVVFLNGCYGAGQARIVATAETAQPSAQEQEPKASMTQVNSRLVMGIASSLTHVGAAGVIAPRWAIGDTTAVRYASHWYTYLAQGCSIGEATLLAKIECIRDMQRGSEDKAAIARDYAVLSYVVWGNPTLRYYPLTHLVENYPETAKVLLKLKREVS
ncbi:MAG: CHAT domain-containing protein [Caldilinea sp. CFX5]|nr:CHAT domain-containing protein [Caldilinea sp. CFX5]